MRGLILLWAALVLAAPAQALTQAQARALATGETATRIATLNGLVGSGVPDDKPSLTKITLRCHKACGSIVPPSPSSQLRWLSASRI